MRCNCGRSYGFVPYTGADTKLSMFSPLGALLTIGVFVLLAPSVMGRSRK